MYESYFFSIKPQKRIRNLIYLLEQNIKKEYFDKIKIRITDQYMIHITLLFLGYREDINNIIKETNKIKSNHFSLEITNIGFFNNRIIYLGIKKNENLNTLRNKIIDVIGFKEHRKYVPHITLARINKISQGFTLNQDEFNKKNVFHLNKIDKIINIRSFYLMKSQFDPSIMKIRYKCLKEFDLK